MKKLFFSLVVALLLFVIDIAAQVPQGFSYQAVIRNSEGQVLPNKNVTLKISLTNSDGTVTHYTETHVVITNTFGLIGIIVGNGTNPSASLNSVPWSEGAIFLKVESMLEGATVFTDMGSQKLQSVPFALYAADGLNMQWLGALPNPPSSPLKNNAYYNTFDKVSYIWDGDSWEILTVDGIAGPQGSKGDIGETGPKGDKGDTGENGISLRWLGTFNNEPLAPTFNDAYYNTTNRSSYVWDGNSWELISKDGSQGIQGEIGPKGDQGIQGTPGLNGKSLIWLGTRTVPPLDPNVNDAYYNSIDKISYIWNGVIWDIVAKDGAQGIQGEQGEIGTTGPKGDNGISLNWLGSFDTAPTGPSINNAYRNNIDKISYVWNGASWNAITYDGAPGPKGDKGETGDQGPAGTGLNFRGNWSSAAVYATSDYVFGESSSNPEVNSMWICQAAVGPTATKPKDDASHWVEFQAQQGPAGSNGISIEWLGNSSVAPASPTLNQAYYNSVDKISYVWDGDSWEILAKDGAQGPEGPLVAGTTGQTLRHNGTSWVANSVLYNNGTNIGINVVPTQALDVNGRIRLRSYLYDYNNSLGSVGQYLSRSSLGVVWQTPNWVTGTGTSGTLALWNGTTSLTTLPNLSFSNSFVVVGNPTANPDDPIFEVKNSAGEVIFGVYQEGVRINIKDAVISKGAKGGFAVGGLSTQSKAGPVEYFRITPDSARIYVKEEASVKGAKGGFAVGGLSTQSKAVVSRNLLFVAPDSARIYVDTAAVTKGAKGGFAVGGLSTQSKAASTSLFQLTKKNYFIGFESGLSTTTGVYNSFLGFQAGRTNATGSFNTFLGYQSGMSNTGSDNTFIGYQAGKVHQSKGGNVYIGSKAGGNAQNGERNVLIGESAGYGITSGLKNVIIGFEAGYSTAGGNYNVFLGTTTGRANTSGSSNVFVGIGSGLNNTTGSNNVFLGTNSGMTNTTGGWNTILGYEAGYTNNANYNSFVGYQAGKLNSTGQHNSFFGFQSGLSNTSGSNNIFMGYMAGLTNSTASNNVFIGNESGRYNSTGTGNSFLGNFAGLNNTTGTSNVFIGNQSGRGNTTGNSNVMIGEKSGYSNQSGFSNIIMGKAAGYSGTNLQYNVFIGDSTGFSTTSQYATTNVFIGFAAGRFNNSYNNVYIGNKAGYTCSTGQNNIAIGDLAGYKNTSSQNVFIGTSAGENNTEGYFNIMIGRWTGKSNTTGAQQILIGGGAGGSLTTGGENVIIGNNAGTSNITGVGNVYIGTSAGWSNTGSKNVFIGYKMGYGTFQNVSNALVIGTDVSGSNPLIYGEFDNQKLLFNAKAAINTDNSEGYRLNVLDNQINNDNPAIFGQHNITTNYGIGVKGVGGWKGVEALNQSTSGTNYGLYAVTNGSGTGTRYGVYATASGGATNYAGYFAGSVHTTGSYSSSDIKLKKNISRLEGSLKKLLQIDGVLFDWKTESEITEFFKRTDSEKNDELNKFNYPKGRQIGVIAQDVEKVLPEVVSTDGDGLKSVDYSKMVPLLIEAIKEQQKIITSQDEKLMELQRQIEELNSLIKGQLVK